MVKKLDKIISGIESLVNSKDTQEGVKSLAKAAKEAEGLIKKMNEKIGPIMADLRATSEAAGKEETIGVGPVSIPDSLDRSQIATLSGGNEVIIAEFDRWSGSCRDEIARVLTEKLSALLPSQRVVSYAWGRRISLNRQITVDILRLDGVLGKTVILKANWAILEENGTKTNLVRRSNISEPVNGGDYASFVAAQSRALDALSREIAATAQSPR